MTSDPGPEALMGSLAMVSAYFQAGNNMTDRYKAECERAWGALCDALLPPALQIQLALMADAVLDRMAEDREAEG